MAIQAMRWAERLTPSRMRQLWYAPLLAAAMGLMMARMLLLARLLDVQQFAQFSGGVLISGTFCMLGCLGLQSQLQREWPVNLLRGQERRGLVLAAQCNLVAAACSVVGLLATASGLSLAAMPQLLLAVGILHGFSQQIFLIATVESRSRGDALRFAWENMGRAAGALVLGAGVAVATRSALWALTAEALVSIGLSLELFRKSVARVSFGLRDIYCIAVRRLGRVKWGSALTLMAITAVGFVAINADRWVAADQLDLTRFGHYSFAWIVLMVAQAVQAVINASLYPMLARRFAIYGPRGAFRVCVGSSAAVLIFGSICIVPLWFVLSRGIQRWFPMYADAIGVLPIFLTIALLRVSDFWSSYLLIIGREMGLLALNVAVATTSVIVWAILIRPWASAQLSLREVAMLGAILTVLTYAAAVGFAWQTRAA